MSPGNFMVLSQNMAVSKIVGLWLDFDRIVNQFWKVDLDLDCQSHFCDGFGLDWQSK